jgi:hypothetical protein
MAARIPAGATVRQAQRLVGETAGRRTITGVRPLHETSRLLPRLAALAPSMADAVQSMGGWLFDQAMVGLDTAVLTAEQSGERAALILGARARDLAAELAEPLSQPWFQSIAVHVAVYERDPRVRRAVRSALGGRSAEVMFCGPLPDEFAAVAKPVWYQLSIAARAFKAHALAALPAPAILAASGPADFDQAVEVFSRVSA